MAKLRNDKKVVVNQVYFDLIEQKAKMLDSMFDGVSEGQIVVSASDFKEYSRIGKEWGKVGASAFEGTEELYVEPKAQK